MATKRKLLLHSHSSHFSMLNKFGIYLYLNENIYHYRDQDMGQVLIQNIIKTNSSNKCGLKLKYPPTSLKRIQRSPSKTLFIIT